MIQRAFITEWRSRAPWPLDSQVEQDLVLVRALVDLYSDESVGDQVALRGGTALHKLFSADPERYSEDIDLVQIEAGPIGAVMDSIRRRLDPWLGKSQWKQGHGRVTLYYRFMSEMEPVTPMRLKLEINTREHFSVLGFVKRRIDLASGWHSGSADITTYELEELLGTKLRALYQRKKSRDLFDLWTASRRFSVDRERMVRCFLKYIEHDGLHVSRAQFEANLRSKLADPDFGRDIEPLLTSAVPWNQKAAAEYALNEIAPLLPGDRR